MNLPEAIRNVRAGHKAKPLNCPVCQGLQKLSVFAGTSGWIGIHCFKGCDRLEILKSEGLTLCDIGPERQKYSLEYEYARSAEKTLEQPLKPISWPLATITEEELRVISENRGIPIEGLRLAVSRQILFGLPHKGRRCYVVTDPRRIHAQVRRCNGEKFDDPNVKALTHYGEGRSSWPIGLASVTPEQTHILFCEGGPDLLAAHWVIVFEGREGDTAAVCVTGGSRISPDAAQLFEGKFVRIFQHADEAGENHVRQWMASLKPYAASLERIVISGIHRFDGQPAKDLNDLIRSNSFAKKRSVRCPS